MAGNKTAALMACACSIDGPMHLDRATLAMALAGFGAHIGRPSGHRRPADGIRGAPKVTGKPVRADLQAAKKSLQWWPR